MDNETEYNQAYAEMVGRHEKIIFSVCFFYATADVGFDDLRQEVLISLFKGYRHFRHESAESTWVYKVALNTCLFSLKKLSPKVKTFSIDEMPSLHLADEVDSEARNRLEWLRNAISLLNPLDKAIILMWLDELSYEDIALNIGIPRNTVASRINRIKKKLANKSNI